MMIMETLAICTTIGLGCGGVVWHLSNKIATVANDILHMSDSLRGLKHEVREDLEITRAHGERIASLEARNRFRSRQVASGE